MLHKRVIVFSYFSFILYISGLHVTDNDVKAACPCSDLSLCKPITKTPQKEIFTFSFSKDERVWAKFNWTKVTTIISGINTDFMCYAHKHGARFTVLTDFPLSNITDEGSRKAWIQHWLQVTQDNFMDGINIDVEEPISKKRKDLRDAYTLFIKEVTTAFKSVNPNYQITVDVPYSPNCIYGRCYDYLGLANYSDFLLVMDYDEANSAVTARPNSGYYQSRLGLQQYLHIGVPKEKLVMAFPWYGYSYPCKNITTSLLLCEISRSEGKVTQKTYSEIADIIKNSSRSSIMWDDTSLTPYFNYKYQNFTYQMRYDNLTSLQLKYKMAYTYQIRGTGMWVADNLDYLSNTPEAIKQRTEMWQALPDYRYQNAYTKQNSIIYR